MLISTWASEYGLRNKGSGYTASTHRKVEPVISLKKDLETWRKIILKVDYQVELYSEQGLIKKANLDGYLVNFLC